MTASAQPGAFLVLNVSVFHSLTFKAFSQTKISREIVYSGPPLLLEGGQNIAEREIERHQIDF